MCLSKDIWILLKRKFNIKYFLFVFIFFCATAHELNARHIIGGDVTYKCLGATANDPNIIRYELTLKVYRDCASGGAEFDNPARIGIYRGNNGGSYTYVNQVNVGHDPIVNINEDDNPCLIVPAGVCVQEATYVFELELPVITQEYLISYQRCCRNETINNIVDPRSTGATYQVTITPEAQLNCNDGPVFKDFPPIAICAGQPINFDHSAIDSEGDQLVYKFCAPLTGGGPMGSNENPGDPGACDGILPIPANCAPPFSPVNFLGPTYSETQPLAGDPIVSINNSGIITGVPLQTGQFVVGVCVEEYRNGVLLSTLRRDFQFNVIMCEPLVTAQIESDLQVGAKEYVVNSCGVNTIDFINTSTIEANINSYEWRFDLGDSIAIVNTRDATVTFPDVGEYQGKLLLNEGSECGDSADIFVNIFPSITSDFIFDYDTCVAGAVTFGDRSFSGSKFITDWIWDFGDGDSAFIKNPAHFFDEPGLKDVTLTVIDTNLCVDSLTQEISYFPVPPLLIVDPSTFLGCTPASIFFNNLSVPIDSTYSILWNFGDGSTSTDISPFHTYETPGIYDISLEITSPIGCMIDTIFPDWIEILPGPTAAFEYTPESVSTVNPTVDFTNLSEEERAWQWSFGNEGLSLEENPVYTFQDTGIYEVELVVFHEENQCTDTAYALIDVVPILTYFLPNAFTPNGDFTNDLYQGKGNLFGITDFNLTIWNRWGELLFETNDPREGWNGRYQNTGDDLPVGVYVAKAQFVDARNKPVEIRTFATLIR